ncbi:MAG: hypothetical protein EOP06_01420, partial [Proteobacteria bacterium]
MKTLFDHFGDLWPESRRAVLEPVLKSVFFVELKDGNPVVSGAVHPQSTIVIVDDPKLLDLPKLSLMGYEHIVQRSRSDFAQELLVSALMIARPAGFTNNPLPFLFNGFVGSEIAGQPNGLIIPFHRSSDKQNVLSELEKFMARSTRLSGVADLCLQTADELFTNAIFGAPVDRDGQALFDKRPRTSQVVLPTTSTTEMFAHCNEERVVIGCQDSFGSIRKENILIRLKALYSAPKSSPLFTTPGAGLGFKYMIDNSANFYL